MESTKPSYGSMELYNVWTVDREGEGQRFKAFNKMDNRKLLWHGTNGKLIISKASRLWYSWPISDLYVRARLMCGRCSLFLFT